MEQVQTQSHSHLASALQNKVLRQTYALLGVTLLLSAVTAWVAMAIQATPVNIWLFLIGAYGLLFATQALRNSAWGLLTLLAFTSFMGYALGPILSFYMQTPAGASTVALAFTLTAVIFFGLSGFVLVTGKSMSFLARTISAGALVLIALLVASFFVQSSGFHLMLSGLFAIFASMLILYQTSSIIEGGETSYISATLTLYISIYNLFMSLLHLLTAFGRE